MSLHYCSMITSNRSKCSPYSPTRLQSSQKNRSPCKIGYTRQSHIASRPAKRIPTLRIRRHVGKRLELPSMYTHALTPQRASPHAHGLVNHAVVFAKETLTVCSVLEWIVFDRVESLMVVIRESYFRYYYCLLVVYAMVIT